MDKPGLARAIPYMIAVFVLSLAIVYGIRTLQDMDPVWMNVDSSEGAQVGLVLAAFASMGAFMWGVGAFDPKMSEHGDQAHEVEETAPESEFTLKTSGPVFRLGKWLWDLAWQIINDTPKPKQFPYLNVGLLLIRWIINVVWFLIWLAIFGGWRFFLGAIAGIPGTLGAVSNELVLFVADHRLLRRSTLPGTNDFGSQHHHIIRLRAFPAWLAPADSHGAQCRRSCQRIWPICHSHSRYPGLAFAAR